MSSLDLRRPSLFAFCGILLLGASAAPAATDLTFFLISDVHYGNHTATNDTNRNRMPGYLNNLPGTAYPASIGGKVATPRGVLLAGDLIETQDTTYWNQYTADYGISGEKKMRFPVFDALGNHDFTTAGSIKDTLYLVKKMIQRNAPRKSYFVNMDSAGFHYSWDWDGVHFVNLNLYAGSTELGYNGYRPLKAREFLEQDLAANVGTSGRPVIIFQHYTMGANTTPDWTDLGKAAVYALLQNYNVVAILHGHSHAKKLYKWNNIDVVDDGAVILGDMVVFHITDGHLQAVYRNQQTWSSTLILDKTIGMGTPIAVRDGKPLKGSGTFLFTIPGAGWSQNLEGAVRRLEIADLQGRRVRLLRPAENHVEWNRLDARGRAVPAGVYLIREADRKVLLGKIVLR